MIISGLETEQNFRFNKIKDIKDNTELEYLLTNRIDSEATPNAINWGDSVLLGIDNNDSTQPYTTITASVGATKKYLKIFDIDNINAPEWEIRNVSEHWILISSIDKDSTTNFNEYFNTQNPSSDSQYRIKEVDDDIIRYIRKSVYSKIYEDQLVEMKPIDTTANIHDFGTMNMKIDLAGNIIVYNLSVNYFLEIEEKNIENILFNLCISNETYAPIIRGLKFEEKIRDLDYLVFSYYTNQGKQFITFTTRTYLSDYTIYSDVFITDNLYNSVANDLRTPSLYNNLLNDMYCTEFIDMFTYVDSYNAEITDKKYTKQVFEDHILSKTYVSDAGEESLVNYTVLSQDNYTLDKSPILISNFGDGSSVFDITEPIADTMRVTYNSGTDPQTDIRLEIGNIININAQNFDTNNNGIFIITAVAATYFEVTNANVVVEGSKSIGTGIITYSSIWIEKYDEQLFLISDTDKGAKEYYLNNLFLTFQNAQVASDKEIRIIMLYLDDGAGNKELVYESYIQQTNIFENEQKTFRILI